MQLFDYGDALGENASSEFIQGFSEKPHSDLRASAVEADAALQYSQQ